MLNNIYNERMILDSKEVLDLIDELKGTRLRSSWEARERCEEIVNTLVQAHTGIIIKRIEYFVKKVFKTRKSKEFLEVLYQEGVVGLLNAINKFDTSYDNAFSTYAVYHIDKALSIAMKKEGEIIHFPLWIYDWINRESKHDYSDSTKLAIKYQRNMRSNQRYLYIETDDYDREENSSIILESEIIEKSGYESEQEFYSDAVTFMNKIVESASQKEIEILRKNMIDNESLKEIGSSLNMSGEGVNKIRIATLTRLKVETGMTQDEIVIGLTVYSPNKSNKNSENRV